MTPTYDVAAEDGDMTEHWHWGSNIPGYLPMADEPNIAEDWETARDALLEDVDRCGDMLDVDDYAPGWGASWEAALEEIRSAEEGDEIYVNVASDGPHDLGVSYWVVACNEVECIPQWEHDPQRDGAGCSWCGRFAQVNRDNLCRECFADDDSDGGYVTAATLWVLCAVVALATILASYVGDSFAAMRDAGATATSDTATMEVRADD